MSKTRSVRLGLLLDARFDEKIDELGVSAAEGLKLAVEAWLGTHPKPVAKSDQPAPVVRITEEDAVARELDRDPVTLRRTSEEMLAFAREGEPLHEEAFRQVDEGALVAPVEFRVTTKRCTCPAGTPSYGVRCLVCMNPR